MTDIVHHGNLKSYMSHALDESSYLKALVKQLGTITKDVDPEQGYASTLFNLNKRMLMSEKLLAKELGIKSTGHHSAQVKDTSAVQSLKSASFSAESSSLVSLTPIERLRNFL